MLTDALYELTGSNNQWQLELPQYGTSGSLAGIDFAVAGTSIPIETLIPIVWISGSVIFIESQTTHYTKKLFKENINFF